MNNSKYIPNIWLSKIQRTGYVFVSNKTLKEINKAILESYLKENDFGLTEFKDGAFIRPLKRQLAYMVIK